MPGPHNRGRAPEKSKDFKGAWRKLLRLCRGYLPAICIALVCAVGGTVLTLLGPEQLKKLTNVITDGILTGIDLNAVSDIGALLVCFYAASMLLSSVQSWTLTTVTQRVARQMRADISAKINRLPMAYFNRTSTGDILSRVTNDVDTIGQSLKNSFGALVSSVVQMLGALVMMLLNDAAMTGTAIGATVLGFGLMFFIMSRSQKYFLRQQRSLGSLNGHIEEIYSGHTVVKAYNGERAAREEFNKRNESLRTNGFKAQCLSGLMPPLMGFIGNLGYVAVCVVGATLVIRGRIEFGVIVAFMMYIRLFTQPLNQIAQAMQSMQSAAAAGERVFEFLEAEELSDEHDVPRRLEHPQGRVEFDHVRFGYEDSDRIVIKDFSAVAQPGQKVAIVGPTGAGKTTMVNLLMRFHELKGGEIRIDGVPTSQMSRAEIHDLFCMVLQDTWLFEGTLRENLMYNTTGKTDEDMRRACKAVGLDHFVRTQPKGYDTVLNDRVSLSQGEKQQLTIARAMIADKPMLILDEATSSIDTRTEAIVQRGMDQLMEGRTVFVIAHRLSTVKNSDVIMVLDHGRIIERGSHEKLIAERGTYYQLYTGAFELE